MFLAFLFDKLIPDKHITFRENLADGPQDLHWEETQMRNFICSIDTGLKSFNFKVFS